jgi:conjugative relaxase-like TrwC/TraI family protein
VLSVWKLAHGQEAYYLNAVARGVEDYYVGGEAPGRWIASSDTLLNLDGRVTPEALRAVLAGHDPTTGTRLGRPHRVPGFDLTFRAPKSVSVLFGLGDPDTARAVRTAHDEAVRAALGFAERHAVWSRRGHGGIKQMRGEGLIAAAFRHRTSRNGDPHLHTHVLVPNMVRGEDGQWATIDARWLYASAKTIGYLYEAQLRHNLTLALGVTWGAVTNGIADIDGIPSDVLKAFSTRRAEIEERMDIRGQHSARAAMIAALDTRRAKPHDLDIVRLSTAWREQARSIGFDPEQLPLVTARDSVSPLTAGARAAIEDRLLGPDGLTAHESTFSRYDVLRAWCDAPRAGAPIEQIEELAEHLLDRLAVAPLERIPGRGPVIRNSVGKVLSVLPAGERWTTFELLNIEREGLHVAHAMLDAGRAICDEEDVIAALQTSPTLSDEQVRAVVQITTSGNGIDIVTAPAGAGKTYALATAREAWERAGYRVMGAAHTGVAADELSVAAGIPSTTIARLLIAIDRGEPGGFDRATVLVVEEAGTAGTRDLARLLTEVERTGAKAVLVGDAKQLPEIAAGGLFAGLIARQPTVALRDNRRQREEWERDALRHLRDGDTQRALTAYQEHDRITIGYNADETKHLVVADWWAARVRGEDAVMLAGRRWEVAELNVHGRLRALHAGQLAGPTLEVDGVAFQRGDTVMMLRNDRSVGVRNGNRGVVLDVDLAERTMRVRLPRGDVDLPAAYVDAGHVGHAYAMTVNKAHGLTCDRTMVLGNDQLYRELVYAAMSRGRLSNQIYLSRSCLLDIEDGPHQRTMPPSDPMETLANNVEQRRAKQLALDQMATIPLAAWTTAELHEERRRLRSVLDQAPPDRSADLAALVASRQSLEDQLRAAKQDIARIKGRRRPLLQRHKPDAELIAASNRVSHLEQQAGNVAAEVVRIKASQHQRASHLAAHDVDQLSVDAIDGVLKDRIRQNIVRSVAEPPNYIVRTIGPRPAGGAADRSWVSAVVAIESYRVDHDVTDRRSALGPEPRHWQESLDWYAAHETVADVQVQLGIRRPERQLPALEVEGPSLDLGL